MSVKMARVVPAIFILLAQAARGRTDLPPAESTPEAAPNMAQVRAGWFWMGEDDGRASNQPRHRIYLDAFEIDKTEVTRAIFARFIAATNDHAEGWPVDGLPGGGSLPVVGVLERCRLILPLARHAPAQ